MPQLSAVESPPFPFEPASERRARIALARAVQRHEALKEELHNAIVECVRHLRSCGMPPEAMLVTMKAFVRYAAPRETYEGTSGPTRKPIMEQVVELCIAEYFRDVEPRPTNTVG